VDRLSHSPFPLTHHVSPTAAPTTTAAVTQIPTASPSTTIPPHCKRREMLKP
jgi:hypothetical protein